MNNHFITKNTHRAQNQINTKFSQQHSKIISEQNDSFQNLVGLTAKSSSYQVKKYFKAPIQQTSPLKYSQLSRRSLVIRKWQQQQEKSVLEKKQSLNIFTKLHVGSVNDKNLEKSTSKTKRLRSKSLIRKLDLQVQQKILESWSHFQTFFKSQFPQKQNLSAHHYETEQMDQSQQAQQNIINSQKLVLWTFSKVIHFVNAIYEFIAHKNQQNQKDYALYKSSNLIYQKQCDVKSDKMPKIIFNFLLKKYKTKKLSLQNLINILYSIHFHLEKLKNQKAANSLKDKSLIKFRFLTTFICMLNTQYEEEDIIFYVYAKSIFDGMVRKSIQANIQKVNSFELGFINYRQLRPFLKILSNNDKQLVVYYEKILFQKVFQFNITQIKDIFTILEFLLRDFMQKKQNVFEVSNKISYKSPKLKSSKEKVGCDDFEVNVNYDKQFWIRSPPHGEIPLELCTLIEESMAYNSKKLIQFICPSIKEEFKFALNQIVFIKMIRMIHTVYNMNKVQWFHQMKLYYQSKAKLHYHKSVQSSYFIQDRDIQDIEQLQISLLKIQTCINRGDQELTSKISTFCKRMLTIRPLVIRLQILVEQFEKMHN